MSDSFQITPRQQQILQLLWRDRQLSRWELHDCLRAHPNVIGAEVATLLAERIVRECSSKKSGVGRPRVPVEIDPDQRNVVGLALHNGGVETACLNLRGERLSRVSPTRDAADSGSLLLAARTLLRQAINGNTLAVGISATGFINTTTHTMLSGPLVPPGGLSLSPLYEEAGDRPLVLENNMHAVAARWLLTQEPKGVEDVLLVYFADGAMGAALLVENRPNRGCGVSANELGHVRFYVDTPTCYCGHKGCLERICSSEFLQQQGGGGSLAERAAAFDGSDARLGEVIDYLASGLANATNFIRPHRLVIISEFARSDRFAKTLTDLVRSRLLTQLAEQLSIDLWHGPATEHAEAAGWLALATLYRQGWDRDPSSVAEPSSVKGRT